MTSGRPRKHFPLDKACECCGVQFHCATHYAILKQRFCSTECNQRTRGKGQFQPLTDQPCLTCGEIMRLLPRELRVGKRFCSYSCSSRHNNAGEGNPAWKGGHNNRGAYWKRLARERDGHACQFLGCQVTGKGKSIHAHHKVPRGAGGGDSLENLITLCNVHHREIERRLLNRVVAAHPELVRRELAGVFAEVLRPPAL